MRETVLLLLVVMAVLAGAPGCGSSDSGTSNPQAAPSANPAAPGTPLGNVGSLRLTKLEVGRSVNPDNTMHDATVLFIPTDDVWLSTEIEGSGPRATLQARWLTEKGDVVQQGSQEITPSGQIVTAFHAERKEGWPVGKYRAEILLNGVAVGEKEFEVRQPPL